MISRDADSRFADAPAPVSLAADFRTLFDASPTPLLVVAPTDWVIVAANDARLRITSTTREEQIGRPLFDAFPDDPDDPTADGVANLTASFERVIATRSTDTMPVQRYSLRGPDGTFVERWWAPTNTPVLDKDGAVEFIIHHVEDVTEVLSLRGDAQDRDQAARAQQAVIDRLGISQSALKESEARFRNMADKAPVMMWVTDPVGHCMYLNARWYEFTGQPAGAGEGYGWLDAVHPDDRPLAQAAFASANAEQRDYRIDFRLRRADGVYRWTIDAAAARFDEDGEYLGYVGSVIDIDERREAEALLALNEERLRLATEVAEVGQWDVDITTSEMFWPPRVKAMFGISPNVPVTLADFHSGVHPEDQDKTRAAYEAAGDPLLRELYDVEYRTIGKEDGVIRWVAAKGRGLFDDAGNCVRVIGTAIDITARRKTELALRESEARVRALTDNLPAGMVYQIRTRSNGPDREFLYVSQSHEKLTGIPAADVMADPMVAYNLIVPEDRERLAEAEVHALRDRRPFDVEARYRRTDGVVRWCRILSAPRPQSDGSIIWDGIQIDTTEQKFAEEALRELNSSLERRVNDALADRKLLSDVFDASGAFIQIVDPAFHLIGINKANADEYEKVFGFRPAVGDDVISLLADHPEQRESVREHFSRALAGETFTITQEFGDPALGRRWYEIKFSPLLNDNGVTIGAYHFSFDVTGRRQEQERLAEAEEALRQAQKMEAMGQLTGGVAHDFNNLLTPIVGSLDLLKRRGIGNEREQRMIDGAITSAERARLLVQRLLAFARRQPLQPQAIDVQKVVEGMAELVASSTGPQIKLSVDIMPGIPPAQADQNQLEMALLNLSVNARDAMPNGGTLRISADEQHIGPDHLSGLRPGRYVRLRVADTGTGMDAPTLKRAIEPFFSTKGIGKGTGLGLSMVHGLAAQLDGALAISSTPDVGTNVELFLPVSSSSVQVTLSQQEVEPSATTGTVLLVDDEELVRATTADVLADLGYFVVEAASADEALRHLDRGLVPDVLVTDHLMPGMTGTQLARELSERRPGTRVLLVSGYAEVEGVAPDLARLVKPFRREDLARSLAALDGASS